VQLAFSGKTILRLFLEATQQMAICEGNIFQRIPNAKIILILRDPADRAFAQYMQIPSKGKTLAGFSETCQQAVDQRDASGTLSRILKFLGVRDDFQPDMRKPYLDGSGRARCEQ
jgi:hypothetical protein